MSPAADPEMDLFEALRDLPKTDRGRKHALTALPPPATIRIAARYVDRVGLDTLVEEWLCLDHPNRGRRLGRPSTVPLRAYLVAKTALAMARCPLSLLMIHHLLTSELSLELRALMGFPTGLGHQEDKRLDAKRRAITYSSVHRLSHKVALTFDPQPFPAHRGLTAEEAADIVAGRDPKVVEEKQRRADSLQSLLLINTFEVLPADDRATWSGDLTSDGTLIKQFGRFGHASKQRKNEDSRSPEANAGLHARETDSRDAASRSNAKPDGVEFNHGYDAHISVLTGANELPPLVMAVTMDRPGVAPGLNLAQSLVGLKDAGLPTGIVTVDLGYSQLLAENFALPMRALGYQILQMYKVEDYGKPLATYGGLSLIEGAVYGPCLPSDLRTATRDFHDGRINQDIFEARIEERRIWEVRPKKGDVGATYTVRCPGCGPSRTVRCDYKQVSTRQEAFEAGKRKRLPLVVERPDNQSDALICSNKESVSVPAGVFARHLSAMPYRTPEFDRTYRTARQEMEGKNAYLKNPLGASIGIPGERRFRGWAKQFFTLLIKVVAANFFAINTWIDDGERDHAAPKQRRLGRPKKPGLEVFSTSPNGPPMRIVGAAGVHQPEQTA